MNLTLTVPEGSTNHGNPNLLCTPAKWYDLIIFFFANYLAHAASVIIEPGQSVAYTVHYILYTLFLPGTGVARALRAISLHAATERNNPLKRAARAGALCMVLRKPKHGLYATFLSRRKQRRERLVEVETGQMRVKKTKTETEQLSTITANQKTNDAEQSTKKAAIQEPDETLVIADDERKEGQGSSGSRIPSNPSSNSHWWDPPCGYRPVPPATAIHGEHWLSENSTYYLAMVPPIASMKLDFDVGKDDVFNQEPNNQSNAIIASSYNLPKMLVSFIQAIWAVTTIYRTRGDQIQQYGYAAFGLTVAPYASMSILNTLANMLTPDYPSMFLIRTPMMDKAEEEGEGFFKGAIRVELQDVSPVENMQIKRIYPVSGNPLGNMVRRSQMFLNILRNMKMKWLNQTLEGPWGDMRMRQKVDMRNWQVDRLLESSLIIPIDERSPTILAFICSLIPLAIVGGLSGFHQGNSSQMERGFTMSWLVVGIIYGVIFGLADVTAMQYMTAGEGKKGWNLNPWGYLFALLTMGVPTIGGMAVVGMMIRDFGTCTLIG